MNTSDLIDLISEAAFEVRKALQPGFVESVYQNALMVELELRGLKAQKEVYIPVVYKGRVVGDFRADILVEGKVIIETKAVEEHSPVHDVQLVNYLTATGIDDGLVINYGKKYCSRRKTRLYRQN